jgi:predicted nucleotidyltransferase component of viral defense system
MKPLKQKLIHGYEESLNVSICCYSLEEIIAEKLRTLLQTHQKLINRGWNRPRARDYYDLWRILTEFKRRLNIKKVSSLLQTKCLHRNVQYQTLNDFFSDELVSEAHKHWDSNLRPFVNDLPECQIVLDQLRILLNEIVGII